MRLLKQALAVFGALVVLAVIAAFVAPKKAHALAVALVQIEPGTTTHVGQNQSRLVSLFCTPAITSGCIPAFSPGGISLTTLPYQVPTGSTLIITDYEHFTTMPGTPAGSYLCDTLIDQLSSTSAADLLQAQSCAVADQFASAYAKEHFTTGIRVPSGGIVADVRSLEGFGTANVQGYLVPND